MTGLLILGGTSEARELAGLVGGFAGLETTLSLAGRTDAPLDQGVPTRVGGFGGVDGLVDFLRDRDIDMIVDATHPFATHMSGNAIAAAGKSGLPLVHILRPEWHPQEGENWIRVTTLQDAVDALPPGARAFSATGRGSMDAFAARADIVTSLRVIDPPDTDFPGNGSFVVARPPFSVETERAVLQRHNATHLVVKNSGGHAARTKITAARQLGLPIVIVDRVPLPEGAVTVKDAQGARDWVIAHL